MMQLATYLVVAEIVLLLLLRPVILWYFRVTQAIRLLQSIDKSLKCLPAVRTDAQRIRRAG